MYQSSIILAKWHRANTVLTSLHHSVDTLVSQSHQHTVINWHHHAVIDRNRQCDNKELTQQANTSLPLWYHIVNTDINDSTLSSTVNTMLWQTGNDNVTSRWHNVMAQFWHLCITQSALTSKSWHYVLWHCWHFGITESTLPSKSWYSHQLSTLCCYRPKSTMWHRWCVCVDITCYQGVDKLYHVCRHRDITGLGRGHGIILTSAAKN